MTNHLLQDNRDQVIAMRQSAANLGRRKEYWNDEEKKTLVDMFNEGAGITEMALTLYRSELAVINQLNSLKLYPAARSPKRNRGKCKCPQCSHYSGAEHYCQGCSVRNAGTATS